MALMWDLSEVYLYNSLCVRAYHDAVEYLRHPGLRRGLPNLMETRSVLGTAHAKAMCLGTISPTKSKPCFAHWQLKANGYYHCSGLVQRLRDFIGLHSVGFCKSFSDTIGVRQNGTVL